MGIKGCYLVIVIIACPICIQITSSIHEAKMIGDEKII